MLFGQRKSSEPLYGTDSYRQVDELIRKGRRVWIVSPYIDGYYADYLLRHSRGKDVRIISSSIQQDALRRLTRGQGPFWPALFSFFVLSFDYLLFEAGMLYRTASVASVLLLAMAAASYLKRRKSPGNIAVRVPKGFVHAKMYVGDDVAIEGSANLTFAGMHKNFEHITVMRDRSDVESRREQFLRMWSPL